MEENCHYLMIKHLLKLGKTIIVMEEQLVECLVSAGTQCTTNLWLYLIFQHTHASLLSVCQMSPACQSNSEIGIQ